MSTSLITKIQGTIIKNKYSIFSSIVKGLLEYRKMKINKIKKLKHLINLLKELIILFGICFVAKE